MFCITVDDLSSNDALPVYELPEGSTVLDLKREIEASENIATCFQSLIYNGRPLTLDDEKLDSIIVGNTSDATICLYAQQAQALFGWTKATKPNGATRKPAAAPQVVRAYHDWDGEIKHCGFKGLTVKSGQKYYVINKGLPQQSAWHYGSTSVKNPFLPHTLNASEGYFPKNFVSDIKDIAASARIPPQIPFEPPSPIGSEFKFDALDDGFTYLRLTAKYDLESSSDDPISSWHVTISLECDTFGSRRFSAIGIEIEVPGTTPLKAEVCELEAHRQKIHTEVEVTNTRTSRSGVDGFSVTSHGITGQINGGVSKGKERKISEKGERVAAVKPKPNVHIDGNVIRWNLKAPPETTAPEGICGTESIACIFTKRPVHFKYSCRVQHGTNDKDEKTIKCRSRY